MSSGSTVVWMFIALNEMLFTPFLAWLWYRLYQQRAFFALRKRRVTWVLLYSALLIAYVGIHNPLRLVCLLSPKWRHSWRLWAPSLLVFICTVTAGGWLEVTRLWLLYYKLQLSRATAKMQWAVLIDPRYRSKNIHTRVTSTQLQVEHITAMATTPSCPLPDLTPRDLSPATASGHRTPHSLAYVRPETSKTGSLAAFMQPPIGKELTPSLKESHSDTCVTKEYSPETAAPTPSISDMGQLSDAWADDGTNAIEIIEMSSDTDSDDFIEAMPVLRKDDNNMLSVIDEHKSKEPKSVASKLKLTEIASGATLSDDRWEVSASGVRFDFHNLDSCDAMSEEPVDDEANGYWYIEHLDTFGNPRWCLRVTLVLIVAHSVPQTVVYLCAYNALLTLKFAQAITALLFLCMATLTLCIWYKTPDVNDFMHLKQEVKYLAIANAIGLAAILIALAFVHSLQLSVVSATIVYFVILHVLFGFKFWIVHYWVVERLRGDRLLFQVNAVNDRAANFALYLENSVTPESKHRLAVSDKKLLGHLLQDEDGFHLFMQHMIREFAPECLLSVTELVQFKRVVCSLFPAALCAEARSAEHLQKCPSHIGKVEYGQLQWPRCVPNSPIVQMLAANCLDSEVVATALRVFTALYAKYVAADSRLEINISAGTRLRLELNFEMFSEEVSGQRQMAAWLHRLSHVWDDAVTEMLGHMIRAVPRFTDTAAFDMLVSAKPWVAEVKQ